MDTQPIQITGDTSSYYRRAWRSLTLYLGVAGSLFGCLVLLALVVDPLARLLGRLLGLVVGGLPN